MPLLYRDARIAAFSKPSGLLVHRGWDNDEEVALTRARDALGVYVYPVHRLDRGTSGVLVFALDAVAARELHEAFEGGLVDKRYLALVRGTPPDQGSIDHPIPRKEGGPRVPAETSFRRLHTFERFSVVEASPKTGRLHQVRRHLKHISHPVIGDANYGKGDLNRAVRERFGLARLALHAASVTLPTEAGPRTIEARIPEDFASTLKQMGYPA